MHTAIEAFQNSDSVGKVIIYLLTIGSLIAWKIIIARFLQCNTIRNSCATVFAKLRSQGTCHQILGEMTQRCRLSGRTPEDDPLTAMGLQAARVLTDTFKLPAHQTRNMLEDGILPRPLTSQEVERLQVALDSEINAQQRNQEKGLSMLGSIITLAPMFGLFGTVWGVMATFVAIVANGGRPDIQAIAPGISGALLTTVGGLLVAIPAIFANNGLVALIQKTDKDMEDFESQLIASLQLARTTVAQAAENAPQATTLPEEDASHVA